MLTRQEMFDKVVEGLASQDFQQSVSVYRINDEGDVDFGCVYRGENGLKCAAGWLIPDELYDPNMENRLATGIIKQYPQCNEYLECSDDDRFDKLVNELQGAHDDSSNPSKMINNLRRVAASANLNTKKLDEAEKALEVKLEQQYAE